MHSSVSMWSQRHGCLEYHTVKQRIPRLAQNLTINQKKKNFLQKVIYGKQGRLKALNSASSPKVWHLSYNGKAHRAKAMSIFYVLNGKHMTDRANSKPKKRKQNTHKTRQNQWIPGQAARHHYATKERCALNFNLIFYAIITAVLQQGWKSRFLTFE